MGLGASLVSGGMLAILDAENAKAVTSMTSLSAANAKAASSIGPAYVATFPLDMCTRPGPLGMVWFGILW